MTSRVGSLTSQFVSRVTYGRKRRLMKNHSKRMLLVFVLASLAAVGAFFLATPRFGDMIFVLPIEQIKEDIRAGKIEKIVLVEGDNDRATVYYGNSFRGFSQSVRIVDIAPVLSDLPPERIQSLSIAIQ